MTMTRQQAVILLLATALIDTVNETPEGAPEGILYASYMAQGLSLDTFQQIVAGCIDAGRITRKGDCLFPTNA